MESNWQSAEWTAASKVLVHVFWDAQGILFIDYLENSKYIALLVSLKEEIVRKWPQMKRKKGFFTKTQVDRNDSKIT